MAVTRSTLDALDCIRPLPQLAVRVIRITSDPDYDVQELHRAVSLDQGVTASVLQLVNSTAYALRHPVVSLEHALKFVGPRNLSNMVLSVCSSALMCSQRGLPEEEQERTWRHSVAVAIASDELARITSDVRRDLAFTAGLLHDIGRVAIAHADLVRGGPPDAELGESWIDRERAIAGADHDELGAILIERWKLPIELLRAIRHHSDPTGVDDRQEARLAAVLHLAEVRCAGLGMGAFEEGREAPLRAECAHLLDLSGEDLGRVWPRVARQIEKAEGLLKLRA